jgi:hypothetical protein
MVHYAFGPSHMALHVEKVRAERWTGQFPQTVVGEKLNTLFTLPLNTSSASR